MEETHSDLVTVCGANPHHNAAHSGVNDKNRSVIISLSDEKMHESTYTHNNLGTYSVSRLKATNWRLTAADATCEAHAF